MNIQYKLRENLSDIMKEDMKKIWINKSKEYTAPDSSYWEFT